MTSDDSGAAITAVDWPYSDLDTPLTGVLCRDESLPGARPGVLLVHGGAGLDEHARGQARRYAAVGCALRGFTHSGAAPGAVPGVVYNPAADRRSFSATSGFFADVFAR